MSVIAFTRDLNIGGNKGDGNRLETPEHLIFPFLKRCIDDPILQLLNNYERYIEFQTYKMTGLPSRVFVEFAI